VGDFHLPVRVVGRLRLVEGDDGVDQGKAVLPQTRLTRGDALPGGLAGLGASSPEAAVSARPAGVQYQ
jgi:hypothetical protein